MNANSILFRSSSLGYIMIETGRITEIQLATIDEYKAKPKLTDKQASELARLILKRDAPPEISESCKTHLVDVYVLEQYNRFTEVTAKQLDKGNETEEDSITTVSRITKTLFKKNEDHLTNEYIKGTPDIFTGLSIYNAETVRDTKSSWDAFTFFRAKHKPLDSKYYWQIIGYMWLTGAKIGYIDYCLNNTPYHLVESELIKESYGHPERDTPAWIELQIIANHVYDKRTFDEYVKMRGCFPIDENSNAVYAGFIEIPLRERHFSFEVQRNENDINKIKEQVKACRDWMNLNLFKTPLVMLAHHDTQTNSIIVEPENN